MVLPSPVVSRRLFLTTVAAIGVPACSGSGRHDAALGTTPTPPTTGAATTTPATDPADVVRRKLERLTFGVTPGLLVAVDALGGGEVGVADWLDGQLTAPPVADAATQAVFDLIEVDIAPLAGPPTGDAQARARARRTLTTSIAARVVTRAALGPDQVRQRLVDVFAEHLHVTSAQAPDVYYVAQYDAMLREHVLGRFADLLQASARSTAMLLFLDNATSRADGGRDPNENYARELLELHTVGVDGGYDEQDVVEVAHVLSGWSLSKERIFTIKPKWHDLGPIAGGGDILGWTPALSGEDAAAIEAVGTSLLDHLAHHRATARRIAHLLARRFVSDTIAVDHPLIESATAAYLDHDTSIAATLRHLMTSDRFEDTATLMVRRPVDLVASLVRRGGIPVEVAGFAEQRTALVGAVASLGQIPYGWAAPDGAPTASAAWATSSDFIGRWNAVTEFAHHPRLGLPPERVAEFCGPDGQLF